MCMYESGYEVCNRDSHRKSVCKASSQLKSIKDRCKTSKICKN